MKVPLCFMHYILGSSPPPPPWAYIAFVERNCESDVSCLRNTTINTRLSSSTNYPIIHWKCVEMGMEFNSLISTCIIRDKKIHWYTKPRCCSASSIFLTKQHWGYFTCCLSQVSSLQKGTVTEPLFKEILFTTLKYSRCTVSLF